MKCPDGSLMCNLARAYYPAWRQHQSVSLSEAHVVPDMQPFGERGPRRFDHFVVRSWDKGYNWTPLAYPLDLFPIGMWSSHATGDSGPHELSDGRWMWSVQGLVRHDNRRVAGVTYSSDKGHTWSPVKLIYDLPYASATEQRIMRLDGRRFLSYTRVDPLVPLPRGRWEYDKNAVHFSLSGGTMLHPELRRGRDVEQAVEGQLLGVGRPRASQAERRLLHHNGVPGHGPRPPRRERLLLAGVTSAGRGPLPAS